MAETATVEDFVLKSKQHELRTLEIMVERMQLRRAALTFGGKRDLYEVLGYERTLSVKDYRDRYARGGVFGRVIDAMPNATWRGGVELIENEDSSTKTQFEQQWLDIERRLNIVAKLRNVDILSRLSTFAVLLIGTTLGDGNLTQELPKGNGTPDALAYLTPYIGGGNAVGSRNVASVVTTTVDMADATVSKYDDNPKSIRFGLPEMYKLKRTSFTTMNQSRDVHWTRVVHVAEGCLDDEVFGEPAGQRCWNLFDDLDKVTGGGAEAFWLRANQGTLFNIDKDVKTLTEPEKAALNDELDKYKHGLTRFLKMRGVDVTTLGSDVANFLNPADAILTQIAGTTCIPKRVLTGSEMGELASTQDRENWADQINGRREMYAAPFVLRRLVQRLIDFNYMVEPKQYDARWGVIKHLTEGEKAEGAQLWANTKTLQGPTFTNDEIRDHWFGMEPIPDDVQAELDARNPMMQPQDPGGAAGGAAGAQKGANLRMPRLRGFEGEEALDMELVERIAEAIEKNDQDTLHVLLGVKA